MLNLSSRVAVMSPSINDRTEKHGDEDVPALDIGVSGIMLTIDELDSLLQAKSPVEAKRLFNTKAQPAEPAFPMLDAFTLTEKLEGVSVDMELGLDRYPLQLEDCSLKGITLKPQTGGMTELSCKVQYSGELEGQDLMRLREAKNKEIAIAFEGGKRAEKKPKKQPELNLDHQAGADGEQPPAAH